MTGTELRDEVQQVAARILQRFPRPSFRDLLQVLDDRTVVPYLVTVSFDAAVLQPGEYGFAGRLGEAPDAGYLIYLHPHFRERDADLPLLLAYQMVVPLWDGRCSHLEAELFGAAINRLEVDDYYRRLCELADEIAGPPPAR